jgi:DNA-binding XRE family transcriptional regulator
LKRQRELEQLILSKKNKVMGAKKKMKMMTLDQVKDKHIGKVGTQDRDKYEIDLQMDVLGEMIKTVRKERKLTQEQLGELIGVQKSQISKLERNMKNVTLETILRVFNALKANIKLSVQLKDSDLKLT